MMRSWSMIKRARRLIELGREVGSSLLRRKACADLLRIDPFVQRHLPLSSGNTSCGLAILALFKNEAHALTEWINHYIDQGVDRFFLVNNNSSDNYLKVLRPFVESGIVALYDDPRSHAQIDIYNDLLPSLKAAARWLIVCDLDEFIYARAGFSSIASFLLSLDNSISAIQIPWKIYGSSGHELQPAEGIASGFCYRVDYDHPRAPNRRFMSESSLINGKYIAKLADIESLDVHCCKLYRGSAIAADFRPADQSAWCPISEAILTSSALHLNHYVIQSRHYFSNIKMTRGDAASSKYDSIRDWDYFKGYDLNEVFDDELARITAGHRR